MWLRTAVDPGWRGSEWDAEHWLFTGDTDNPGTAVWRCSTAACDAVMKARGQRCQPCDLALRAGDAGPAEFAATYVPVRRAAFPGTAAGFCIVSRGESRCAFAEISRGLCESHYGLWRIYTRRHPDASISEWARAVARPRIAAHDGCLVGRCGEAIQTDFGLCCYHHRKWKTNQSATGDPAGWAGTQSPFLRANQFSLLQLGPTLRLEILYALQQRDARGGKIEPPAVLAAVRAFAGLPTLLGVDQVAAMAMLTGKGVNSETHVKTIIRGIRFGYDEYSGIKQTDKEVWDLAVAGVASDTTQSGRRRHPGTADFSAIKQRWFRDIVLAWARSTDPDSKLLGITLKACVRASQALGRRPGGGLDPATLRLVDVDAVVKAFQTARKDDGELYSVTQRRRMLGFFFEMLDFGHRAELMGQVPGGFARHGSHRILGVETNEDETGKAIPETVIRQLDAHLDLLGRGFPYGRLPEQDVAAMMRTVYVVLRDTGRRPSEVAGLGQACLEHVDDEFSLIWNNRKGRRNRRRLPITRQTAHAVQTWQQQRPGLRSPAQSREYLFPAATEDAGIAHMSAGVIARAIRAWADAIPVLHSEVSGLDGQPLPFDRTLIFPYAFRHSYAQRHADAGVPIDVLKELMDHRDASTTAGYFQVSLKRKRAAVKTMRLHVVDRVGRPTPMASDVAYEARSVAVPFGNCIEPSNVKAGGHACPIRFQCAGCGFYRPDPSFLTAVDDHVTSLKADRETAQAMDADEFVVRNLTDQITAFKDVAATMRTKLDLLPAEERAAIEEASTVLRKSRALRDRKLLPLTVTRHHKEPTG
ncbi:tyrosine-type recombinase/integrase [Actinoplanes derwentensis]|uniref:tyrosine-type recombinase/integrase n=1 Tax=Actinoplanes derwentensis TaxID=113562 RepID=UPI0018D45062|nr:tyrosine-type recombinase/integrase [Actinoplanes derwentensis]